MLSSPGHYTAQCWNEEAQSWLNFNDMKVQRGCFASAVVRCIQLRFFLLGAHDGAQAHQKTKRLPSLLRAEAVLVQLLLGVVGSSDILVIITVAHVFVLIIIIIIIIILIIIILIIILITNHILAKAKVATIYDREATESQGRREERE
jgi:hypothetical protein